MRLNRRDRIFLDDCDLNVVGTGGDTTVRHRGLVVWRAPAAVVLGGLLSGRPVTRDVLTALRAWLEWLRAMTPPARASYLAEVAADPAAGE